MQSSNRLLQFYFLYAVDSGTTLDFNRDAVERLLTPMVLGAIVGSVILLISFIAIGILMYKWRKANKSKNNFHLFLICCLY